MRAPLGLPKGSTFTSGDWESLWEGPLWQGKWGPRKACLGFSRGPPEKGGGHQTPYPPRDVCEVKREIPVIPLSLEEWSCPAQGSPDSSRNRSNNMPRGARCQERKTAKNLSLRASWAPLKRLCGLVVCFQLPHWKRDFLNAAWDQRAQTCRTDLERKIEGPWEVKFNLTCPEDFMGRIWTP